MIARLKSPAFLIWLALAMLLVWLSRDAILTRSGWDPDDQLRLVQLRDFLGGQSWFDTSQHRLNAPDGAPMHWSRLIELPLAGLILLFRPLLGQAGAEMVAGTLVPLGCFGAVALMLGKVANELGGRIAGLVAVMMTMVSPAISMQLRPMRIDHHGWQLVCAALSLWSLFWPSPRKAGLATGSALAVWLHISLEGAPSAVVFFALLGWRWAVQGENGTRLTTTVATFTIASLGLFFGTQAEGLSATNFCDTIAPAHVAAIVVAAAVMVPSAFLLPVNRWARLGAAALAALAAAAVLYVLAPQCAEGAFATMDPVVRDYWYIRVSEGMPVWHQKAGIAFSLLGIPLGGLLTLAFLTRNRALERPAEWSVLLVYGFLLAMLVFRTISVATLMAVPVLAVGIAAMFARYRGETVAARRIGYVALMIVMLMPGVFVSQAVTIAAPSVAKQAEADRAVELKAEVGCESLASVSQLRHLKNARILAPFDIGPAILLTTPHQVLASSHHRNEAGMRAHIDIYRLPEADSHKIVEQRGITHIVACTDEAEMKGYEKRNATGLWAQLAKGNRPAWLEPVELPGSALKIWRVVR